METDWSIGELLGGGVRGAGSVLGVGGEEERVKMPIGMFSLFHFSLSPPSERGANCPGGKRLFGLASLLK